MLRSFFFFFLVRISTQPVSRVNGKRQYYKSVQLFFLPRSFFLRKEKYPVRIFKKGNLNEILLQTHKPLAQLDGIFLLPRDPRRPWGLFINTRPAIGNYKQLTRMGMNIVVVVSFFFFLALLLFRYWGPNALSDLDALLPHVTWRVGQSEAMSVPSIYLLRRPAVIGISFHSDAEHRYKTHITAASRCLGEHQQSCPFSLKLLFPPLFHLLSRFPLCIMEWETKELILLDKVNTGRRKSTYVAAHRAGSHALSLYKYPHNRREEEGEKKGERSISGCLNSEKSYREINRSSLLKT